MVREELGAVLLPVPQVIFLSGRQVIGCPLVKGGHAPSHPDADESVAFRRFVSHVVSIAHIFSILWTLHDQAHAVDHVLVPSRDLLLLRKIRAVLGRYAPLTAAVIPNHK